MASAGCSGPAASGYFTDESATEANQHPCPEGYFCPVGSTNVSAVPCRPGYRCPLSTSAEDSYPCSPGYFSESGSVACTACGPGRYGGTSALRNLLCSGLCSPGFYCGPGSTSPVEHLCRAGHVCPEGTGDEDLIPCPPGQYSIEGAIACTSCPAGRFGSVAGVAFVVA